MVMALLRRSGVCLCRASDVRGAREPAPQPVTASSAEPSWRVAEPPKAGGNRYGGNDGGGKSRHAEGDWDMPQNVDIFATSPSFVAELWLLSPMSSSLLFPEDANCTL
jgi:hypothetical protein